MNSNLPSISRFILSSSAKTYPVTWNAVTEEREDQSRAQQFCLVKKVALFKPLTANLNSYETYHSKERPSRWVVSSHLRISFKLQEDFFLVELEEPDDLDRPPSSSVRMQIISTVLDQIRKFRSGKERFDRYRLWFHINRVLVNISIW